MTTELPPLPKSDEFLCFFEDGAMHATACTGYNAAQMEAYATTALEAQAARVAELENALSEIDEIFEVGPRVRAIARAALAKQA